MPIEFLMVEELTSTTGRLEFGNGDTTTVERERCYHAQHNSRLIAALDRANLLMWNSGANAADRAMHQLTYSMLLSEMTRKVWGLS